MKSLLILLSFTASFAQAQPAQTEYLSDVVLGVATFTGAMGIDTTPYRMWPKVIARMPIQIKDKNYSKGLGIDASGQIIVALDGAYDRFDAEVGVQWHGNPVGNVTFKVFVDGESRFDSGVMHEADIAKPISVSLKDAKEMRLVAEGGGMCNWANARLTRSAATGVSESSGVDMSPFARVVTYDPDRTDGVRVDRLTEIPAAVVHRLFTTPMGGDRSSVSRPKRPCWKVLGHGSILRGRLISYL